MNLQIDLSVSCDQWRTEIADLEQFTRETLQAALAVAPPFWLRHPLELSVLYTDDQQIAEINAEYRDRQGPTNVISFASMDGEEGLEALPDEMPFMLGDVILAMETVAREAREQGKTLRDHCRHLLIHGALHLLGHDHLEDDEAEAMEALEIRLLQGFSVPNPYLDKPLDH